MVHGSPPSSVPDCISGANQKVSEKHGLELQRKHRHPSSLLHHTLTVCLSLYISGLNFGVYDKR